MAPLIGALDPSVWAGLILCDAPGRGFGLRFVLERRGQRADGDELHFLVDEVGPHAPDGSYARVGFDTARPFGKGKATPFSERSAERQGLTIEWSRTSPCSVVLRASIAYAGRLELRGYFPWDWKGNWRAQGAMLTATSADGEATLAVALVASDGELLQGVVERGEEVVFGLTARPGAHLDVTAVVGRDPEETISSARRMAQTASVDEVLDAARRDYEARRVRAEGEWAGLAAAVTNNLHWTVALQPEKARLYVPAGRQWIFPAKGGGREHWTIFCWDGFFNALLLAVEAPELARSALEAVLATAYPNGNVPNWCGRFAGTPDRSQPPIGSFAVLKLFLRMGDRLLLEQALPPLERWSAWWRADKHGRPRRGGRHEGLFTWGADLDRVIDSPASWENEASPHQLAAWESGQDDLPNWDEAGWSDATETFELDAVDLNSYLALDFDCLACMAAELGDMEKAEGYRARYKALKRRVNERLWNEELGLYLDRFGDGRFSRRVAASNFLPLLAGIASERQAERMLAVLEDEGRFWGEYVLPTISRDDPAFEDQQYWRGAVWPPMNYLIAAGLRRYRLDDAAAELARRSVELLLPVWRRLQCSYENYDAGTGRGGGHLHQSWGPLLALVGLEELIDVTPWEGLRIGTLVPELTSTLKRLRVRDHLWTLRLSAHEMSVEADGKSLLEATGPLVLRQVRLDARSFEAELQCREVVRVNLMRGSRVLSELEGELFRSVSNTLVLQAGHHHLRASSIE